MHVKIFNSSEARTPVCRLRQRQAGKPGVLPLDDLRILFK